MTEWESVTRVLTQTPHTTPLPRMAFDCQHSKEHGCFSLKQAWSERLEKLCPRSVENPVMRGALCLPWPTGRKLQEQ